MGSISASLGRRRPHQSLSLACRGARLRFWVAVYVFAVRAGRIRRDGAWTWGARGHGFAFFQLYDVHSSDDWVVAAIAALAAIDHQLTGRHEYSDLLVRWAMRPQMTGKSRIEDAMQYAREP